MTIFAINVIEYDWFAYVLLFDYLTNLSLFYNYLFILGLPYIGTNFPHLLGVNIGFGIRVAWRKGNGPRMIFDGISHYI
jgi:hypothetical protein